jgi:RNA polymerase-binding transcription factor DksA
MAFHLRIVNQATRQRHRIYRPYVSTEFFREGETIMEQLSHRHRAKLEEILVQRERALREDIQRELIQQEDFAQVAGESPDPGDLSFADLSVDLGNASVTRDLNELRAVQQARQRLQSSGFGECISCGYPIPFERLLVMPTSERCARCQQNFEHTHQGGKRGASM